MPETKTLLWSLQPGGRFLAEKNGYELVFDRANCCLEISTVDYHVGVLRLDVKVLFPGTTNTIKKPKLR